MISFVAGLGRDHAAVEAAFGSPWSNGQVEGHVHRLKLIKRQMYGRAGFLLLVAEFYASSSINNNSLVLDTIRFAEEPNSDYRNQGISVHAGVRLTLLNVE